MDLCFLHHKNMYMHRRVDNFFNSPALGGRPVFYPVSMLGRKVVLSDDLVRGWKLCLFELCDSFLGTKASEEKISREKSVYKQSGGWSGPGEGVSQ